MAGFGLDASSRRLPAVLVYDTAAQPLTPGLRSVAQRSRRLLFMAAETELLLQVARTPVSARLKLLGQVLDDGEPVAGAAVALCGPAGPIVQATDDDGQFSIDELPKGAYAIDCAAGHHLLSVADLALA